MCKQCLIIILFVSFTAFAEKVLLYDEEKGIIFVDKESVAKPRTDLSKPKTAVPQQVQPVRNVDVKKSSPHDIHVGRKKDPPELYFASGLEFFKNGEFLSAFNNFAYADSIDPQPRYLLWKGKTYRQLGKEDSLRLIMLEILQRYPKSDVADDALFEIAFYHQVNNDYDSATLRYTELAEQYPFGVSYSNGEEFLQIAREQRRYMRSEMLNLLSILGFASDELQECYNSFQKAHGLPINGKGDKKTVETIKEKHRQYVLHEESKVAYEQKLERHKKYIAIAGAVGLLNILLFMVLHFVLQSRIRHLKILEQTLNDLNLNKI